MTWGRIERGRHKWLRHDRQPGEDVCSNEDLQQLVRDVRGRRCGEKDDPETAGVGSVRFRSNPHDSLQSVSSKRAQAVLKKPARLKHRHAQDAEDAQHCCFRYTKETITALVEESRARQQVHATLAEFDLNGPEPNERRDMPSSSSTTHMERRDAGGGELRALT